MKDCIAMVFSRTALVAVALLIYVPSSISHAQSKEITMEMVAQNINNLERYDEYKKARVFLALEIEFDPKSMNRSAPYIKKGRAVLDGLNKLLDEASGDRKEDFYRDMVAITVAEVKLSIQEKLTQEELKNLETIANRYPHGHYVRNEALDKIFANMLWLAPTKSQIKKLREIAEEINSRDSIAAYGTITYPDDQDSKCMAIMDGFSMFSIAWGIRLKGDDLQQLSRRVEQTIADTRICSTRKKTENNGLIRFYILLLSETGLYGKAVDILRDEMLDATSYSDISEIANLHRKLGNFKKAEILLNNGVAKATQEGSEWASDLLYDLVILYMDSGKLDEAEEITLIELDKSLNSPDNWVSARLIQHLSKIDERRNNLDSSIFLQKLAISLIEQNFDETIKRQSGLAADILYGDHYRRLAKLLVDNGSIAEAVYVLELLKYDELYEFTNRGVSPMPQNGMVKNNLELSFIEKYQQLKALAVIDNASLARELGGLQGSGEIKAGGRKIKGKTLSEYMTELRSIFVATLSKSGASYPSANTSVLSRQILSSLDKGTILLQYYIVDDKTGILLTTPTRLLAREIKVSSKELNRKIFSFGQLLRDAKSDLRPASQELYNILIKPIEDDLVQSGAKTVMLSLDGNLRHLPFAALHDGKRYLAERWNLPMYTSVTKERLLDDTQPNWKVAGLGVTRKWGNLAPLPGVRAELTSIIKNGEEGILPGEMYLDEAFTSDRLRKAGSSKTPVVHISSHFQFSPGTEVNSYLLLGDGKHLTLGDLRTQNYRFDGVDLLTLSACETAQGGGLDTRGREIEGFGVIAQKQGAKSVLATLWKIEDQSTAGFMADMYRQRQVLGLNKAAALRQAQINMINNPKYAHPYYWAPFILMGNWR